jgi:hypothetical protein
MAIKAPTTSSKPALYKMVSLPSYGTATGTKGSSESKTVVSSYSAFLTSVNRMGATLNSVVVVNNQILKTLKEDLNLQVTEYESMKSSFLKEKAGKDIDGTDEGAKEEPWWKKAIGGFAKAVIPNFFEGLAQLGSFFLRAFVVQGVLRWMSDPKNGEKLAKIVGGLVKIFSWLYQFVTENLFKTIEGLVDMFDGDKNIWERIVGFGKFITGFGALLLGMAFLKKPTMVIRGFVWVLTTLYKNLFKTKAKLAKQTASGGVSAGTGAAKGGRGRGLATFAAGAAAGALVSGMMGGGGDDDSSPEPSMGSAPSGPPLLAAGGIATKPTQAILGERGPEITMPLSRNMPIPSDNNKRRKDAGIKPLSSLGSMGGTSDPKQANNLSKLFMAPFKGIGAGILANISQVVSSIGGPAGQLITPLLGNIIAPIANSFGIPPTVVKTVQGKMFSMPSQKVSVGDKRGGDVKKLFGKAGSVPSAEEKKFKKKNDSTVLGLLSDILGASIVINNKLKGSGSGSDTTSSDSSGSTTAQVDAPVVEKTPGSTGGGATGGATNTAQETIKKAGGVREDGTLQGIKGTTKDMGRAGKEHSPGAGLMPVDGGNRKYWYNNSGDVFMWQKPGDPLTDLTSAGDKSMISSNVLGGPMVRDLKDGKVKILKGMMGGDQTPVGYFSYDMGAVLKSRGNSGQGRSKTGATSPKWEKPVEGKYGPTITPVAPEKKSNGGWISGPQSGYPVSLDGGGSTSFIGHGTEWVGFKKASQGGAFVVPFDTPATKNNPGLTSSRMREAKGGGYSLPQFARGGKTQPQSSTTSEKTTDKGTDKKQGSGGSSAAVAAGKYLLGRGFTVAEHPNFNKNSWNKSGPNTGTGYTPTGTARVGGHSGGSLHYKGLALDITDWRGGDWQGRTKQLAEEMYKNRSALKLTQIIHDPWGSWFAGGSKGGGIGGHDSHLHLGFASGPGDAIDLKGGDSSSSGGGGDSGGGEEKELTVEEQIKQFTTKMTSDILKLGGVSTDDVGKATEAAKTEKEKSESAANQRINNAATAAMKNAKNMKPVDTKKAFAMEPIILPGPKTSLPIEALNPSTSMIQYGWKVNL